MRIPAAIFSILVPASLVLAAVPDEVPTDILFEADGATLSWSEVVGADGYHLYRGENPGSYDQSCRLFGAGTPSATLQEVPPAESLFYFLVSAYNIDGEGTVGLASDGSTRPNDSPCLDGDDDLTPDNTDNCPTVSNPDQEDQDGNGAGDRCDPATYDFETDFPGSRPAGMTQLGGADLTFLARDAGGDIGVSYDSPASGQQDRFDRVPAGMQHQDTTVYLDFDEVPEALSLELWSDGAFGWNAGNAAIFQIRETGEMIFYDRHGQSVPAIFGPVVAGGGRLRLRLLKGAGTVSTLNVDSWNGVDFVPGYATFDITDDHRYRGLWTTTADHYAGRRILTRITVVHHLPGDPLTLRKDPSWSSDWQLFQRDGSDRAEIPVRFYYTMEEGGTVQARIVYSTGGGVLPGHDWSDHQVSMQAQPDGGSGELNVVDVPVGGNYDIELRLVRDRDGTILGEGELSEVAVGDIFIAAGQSNMSGYSGNMTGAESPIDEVHLFHNDYTWKRATEPMDDGVDQVDMVSSESPLHSLMLPFARRLYEATGVPVGVIPGPLGGTNLHTQWQRDGNDHDNRGTLYGSMLHRVLLQNSPVRPRGFLWFQGESDVGRSTALYRQDLENLISRYREDLDAPSLPFLIAQLGTYDYADIVGWLAIQEAERQVVRNDPLTALITTVDQPRSDAIHFSVAGYKEIGARFAEAARVLIYGESFDPLTELVEARMAGNGRKIELVYDGDVSGGVETQYRVEEEGVPVGVKFLAVLGNIVTLTLDHRIDGPATVSYGLHKSPAASWIEDADSVPVPCFQYVPVTP